MSDPQPSPPPPSDPDSDVPRWRLWTAPAAIVMGLALGEFGVIIVDAIGHAFGSSFAHPTAAVTIVGDIVVDLAFVAAAIYLVSLQGKVSPRDFGFRRIPWGRGIGAVVLAGGGYYLLTTIYARAMNLHGKDKLPSELGVNKSTAALIAASIFVCAIAPIAEELFFRGFLFGVLRRWRVRVAGRELGPWLAAIVVGILFGLAHTGSASSQYLVPLGFLGFVLCLVRWRTRSLYPCIALHSFNNALALGVNELHWSAAGIIGLIVVSLLVVAGVTAPLSARREPAAL